MLQGCKEMMMEHLILGETADEDQAVLYVFYFFDEFLLLPDNLAQLHPKELTYYQSLKFAPRIKSYLAGRFAAKQAASRYLKEDELKRICIEQGVFMQPVVYLRPVQVSITHCANFAAALAFSDRQLMGIDIEQIADDRLEALQSQMTGRELCIIQSLPHPFVHMLTLFWSAKEALSKVLKTGLTVPFSLFALKEIQFEEGVFRSSFENFYQYETFSFICSASVCSITCPKGTVLNLAAIRKGIESLYESYMEDGRSL
ncbi:4'-phosphopantetheinyl transferase family protein [Paenibacillus donghaensis]|uniref:4'-phosphopantetheinyl transferase domain-containing protein n=1 Tax=Paenibacillus donghaensis TaxID=414771 RepID=A0A2Z2K9J0_9BACL|nr:4'-phosphopantetheinyl transferase superfamily protein [Paenibacillus donghaensis]ASA19510.1 hypothetical protein B9T62_00805 [Paenibacillus donghaensis]